MKLLFDEKYVGIKSVKLNFIKEGKTLFLKSFF